MRILTFEEKKIILYLKLFSCYVIFFSFFLCHLIDKRKKHTQLNQYPKYLHGLTVLTKKKLYRTKGSIRVNQMII